MATRSGRFAQRVGPWMLLLLSGVLDRLIKLVLLLWHIGLGAFQNLLLQREYFELGLAPSPRGPLLLRTRRVRFRRLVVELR